MMAGMAVRVTALAVDEAVAPAARTVGGAAGF